MNRTTFYLAFLLSIQYAPTDVYAKSKHKYDDRDESSMVSDILYTTVGAAFLVGAVFAGRFTLKTYDIYKEDGAKAVADDKTWFADSKFIAWYKKHATTTVPVEIIGLGFFTGLLGSTGLHCIIKGLHLKK